MEKLIRVKVLAGKKKRELIKKGADSFEINVKAKPIQGAANREAIEILADYFHIPASSIRLMKGAGQKRKIFKIC